MRKPSPAEEFRAAMADVAPIAESRRHAHHNPLPPPVPLHSRRDERAVLDESLRGPLSVDDALDSGEELVYLREGYSRQVLRKLRRGHWVVQDNLDLHGMTWQGAAEAVAGFLKTNAARNVRCVRIVHGKGRGSKNREPVLKAKLRQWLPRREEVLGFCQAPAAHGGGGAVLVLLRAKR